MTNLFLSEWKKVVGNRLAAGTLVWIFPIATLMLVILYMVGVLLSPVLRQQVASNPGDWTLIVGYTWNIANNTLSQLAILAFTGIVFGGEYQWGMWKNLVYRSRRTHLVLMKFLVLGVFVALSFVLMTIIAGIGVGLVTKLAGGEYGPTLNGEVLSAFLPDYLLQAGITFTSTLIAASYTAIAAMLSRSILGGVLIGFLFMLAETAILLPLSLLARLFDLPQLIRIYHFTPSYNLANISSWVNQNAPYAIFSEYSEPHTLPVSMLIVALWVVGLLALTVYLFRRQDITN
jgi:hypothetical protein